MLKARRLMPIRESVTGSGIVIELVSSTSDPKEKSGVLFFNPLDAAVLVSVSTPGEMTLPPVLPPNVRLLSVTNMGLPAPSLTEIN